MIRKISSAANPSVSPVSTKIGQLRGKSVKILFDKCVLEKNQDASERMVGSFSITEDKNHKGFLHIVIYIGQVINALISGKKFDLIDFCHSQVILGINKTDKKKGELILGHALPGGIKTTSENHKTDPTITAVYMYKPVDLKMKKLFEKFANQTVFNPKQAEMDKSGIKNEVGGFAYIAAVVTTFYRQVAKPVEYRQRQASYAAADLLLGGKFKDDKGNLASLFCTSYALTLLQGTALVSALEDDEVLSLQSKTRDEIAEHLLGRIRGNNGEDPVAGTYWENDFMQLDSRYTYSYTVAEYLNKASLDLSGFAPPARVPAGQLSN